MCCSCKHTDNYVFFKHSNIHSAGRKRGWTLWVLLWHQVHLLPNLFFFFIQTRVKTPECNSLCQGSSRSRPKMFCFPFIFMRWFQDGFSNYCRLEHLSKLCDIYILSPWVMIIIIIIISCYFWKCGASIFCCSVSDLDKIQEECWPLEVLQEHLCGAEAWNLHNLFS